ncbi:uncharacterized protein Dere_GG18082 [Drosophila erecta]|uniref:Uncharacterized protein n=2 Tax=Drosophila erecta TaxID=7220 RepID=B3NUR5_DROER|nr:uncharacterized protein Dere_GG18082 [Drosophila erecta]
MDKSKVNAGENRNSSKDMELEKKLRGNSWKEGLPNKRTNKSAELSKRYARRNVGTQTPEGDWDIAEVEEQQEDRSVSGDHCPLSISPISPISLTGKHRLAVLSHLSLINAQLKNLLRKVSHSIAQSQGHRRSKPPVVVSTLIRSRRPPKLKLQDVRKVIAGTARHRLRQIVEFTIYDI